MSVCLFLATCGVINLEFALKAFQYNDYLWISPPYLTVFSYLIYLEVGWSGLLATGFVVLLTLLQLCLARIFTKLRYVYIHLCACVCVCVYLYVCVIVYVCQE